MVRCDRKYDGQFDPTNNLTYEVLSSVLTEANKTFEDPYIHFGGDEVTLICWDLKPSIREWMIVHGVSTYKHL